MGARGLVTAKSVVVKILFLITNFKFKIIFLYDSKGRMEHLAWLILAMLWMAQSIDSCPDVCKCSRKSGPEKSDVNCHKRGLRAFPSKLPSDAWIVKLGVYILIKSSLGSF